ncbi:MAG: response regulator [Candidatus Nitrosopolaris sp.]
MIIVEESVVTDTDEKNRKLILLLDDEYDIVNILKAGLEKYGLNIFGFTDPMLALEHFRLNTREYSLVVSDLRMPGMSGLEVIMKVKELKPDIKVFIMTGFEIDDPHLSMVLPSTKIDEFIQKPVLIEKLSIIIHNHIDGLKAPK